jgi:hypothetical protein
MQMSLADLVHTYLIPCLSDLLTGFGLGALLEFSRTSPGMPSFLAICLGVALAAGVLEYLFPSRNVPPWLSLCNATFSLVVTLSLTLNLLSQLCPPSDKDLCLIPAYVMLCVPRMPPSARLPAGRWCSKQGPDCSYFSCSWHCLRREVFGPMEKWAAGGCWR